MNSYEQARELLDKANEYKKLIEDTESKYNAQDWSKRKPIKIKNRDHVIEDMRNTTAQINTLKDTFWTKLSGSHNNPGLERQFENETYLYDHLNPQSKSDPNNKVVIKYDKLKKKVEKARKYYDMLRDSYSNLHYKISSFEDKTEEGVELKIKLKS